MKSLPILCGSISGSIGGLGVKMHNAAYKHLDLPYTYVSFQPAELEGAIKSMRILGIKGLGVTMPFKEDVIPLLDAVTDSVKKIGAVNTVVNEEGKLVGHNTDWYGIDHALMEVTDLTNCKAVVIGAGGAARAALFALKKHTDNIMLYNRHEGRGQELAEAFDVAYKGAPEAFGKEDYDVLINATSVGFKSTESVIEASQMLPDKVVLDFVFTPVETTFLSYAKSLGCKVIPGRSVSLHQACYQFELYTGVEAPIDIMREAL